MSNTPEDWRREADRAGQAAAEAYARGDFKAFCRLTNREHEAEIVARQIEQDEALEAASKTTPKTKDRAVPPD